MIRPIILTIVLTAFPLSSRATARIVAGTTAFPTAAIQDVELRPGTPFNPTGDSILLDDLTALGGFSIVRQAQAGTTIDFTNGDGYFVGTNALIGPFKLASGPTTGIGSYSGSISDIVLDPGDPGFPTEPSSFASGDITMVVPQFGLRLGGGILLFTQDPVTFTAALDGLPPTPGTTLLSPDPVNVFFNPGSGPDLLVAISSNRRLTATPEPSGLALLGAALVGPAFSARWRRPVGVDRTNPPSN